MLRFTYKDTWPENEKECVSQHLKKQQARGKRDEKMFNVRKHFEQMATWGRSWQRNVSTQSQTIKCSYKSRLTTSNQMLIHSTRKTARWLELFEGIMKLASLFKPHKLRALIRTLVVKTSPLSEVTLSLTWIFHQGHLMRRSTLAQPQ